MTDKPNPLVIENIEKSFQTGFLNLKKVKAVKGISLTIKRGEIFGLLGPNGAGKTTTLKMVTGLIFPDKGKISIFGKSSSKATARSEVGFLPENPWFYDYLTAREFLSMAGGIFSIPSDTVKKRSEELLEKLGIAHAADIPMRKYSKGMLQRAGLAQALINNPELIILDEPLSGLDPIGRRELREIILDLRKEGKTVVFSSHILADVEDICDSVAIIAKGKLRETGKLSELLLKGQSYFEIFATGVHNTISELCKSVDETVVVEKTISGTRIQVSTSEISNNILKKLVMENIEIKKFDSHKKSLEDLFMESSSNKSDEEK
ncbi:MAG: ABC transporter ATP-binding protein [Deltaproteobacteria bacterium]|nr:ABC transporter ATP-binding protein [Deltaproteobacteria bacterium]